jgi:hypothetical protein
MNKYPIVALVLLLAGMALVLNSSGISCPFAGENSSCQVNGNGSGNCGLNCSLNCSGNCSENGTCSNGATAPQNNSTEENCTALGSCPVKNR